MSISWAAAFVSRRHERLRAVGAVGIPRLIPSCGVISYLGLRCAESGEDSRVNSSMRTAVFCT